ncbi:MAG: hypothetical protein SH856_11900 [Flavobacteriales bacterium]|nr:hypothetical protein [Flavobacteriales bacterium]
MSTTEKSKKMEQLLTSDKRFFTTVNQLADAYHKEGSSFLSSEEWLETERIAKAEKGKGKSLAQFRKRYSAKIQK